jgi:CubicO group peptidase (beta-lactamase class C family)
MIKLFLIIIMGVLSSCSKENIMENNLMKIDQIFSDYNSLGMPGAAVMIIQDGTPILQKGFGMADLKQGLPVTPKTNFRLASITKQFTAMSILQLVERGNLSLDTNLLDIFSEFPDYGKIITIKDLLHHTSGLYDYEGLEPKGQVRQLKDKDVLTSMMSMEGAYFPAGEKHRYSNTAYVALTQIIEKET